MNFELFKKTNLLLLCSAFCYGFAFLLPNHLWWLIFFYPVFIVFVPERVCFFSGFFWSLIAHGIHLLGIADALYQMGISFWIISGMFVYVATTNGFIFACIKKVVLLIKTKENDSVFPILSNVIAIIGSHYWMTSAILFPFGRFEGYIFMHPIILFIDTPFRSVIQTYHIEFFILLFYGITITGALFFKQREKRYFLISIFFLLLFVLPFGFKVKNNGEVPIWIDKVAVVALFFPDPKNLTAICDVIKQKINVARQKNTNLRLFLLPEGAINCPLSSDQLERLFGNDVDYSMIICSQSFKKQKLRNSCFFFTNNRCHGVYHKRHTLLVTEQPLAYQETKIRIWPSKNKRPLFFSIDQNLFFVPYICSDFFFQPYQDDDFHDAPIILLCNDIWSSGFFGNYIQQLMCKTAQLKAINWNRLIIYVAYSASYCIDSNGNLIKLTQIQ